MALSSQSGTLQEDSYCVGAGARPILKEALEHQGSKTDAEMLTALHSYLKPKLEAPPLGRYLKMVIPRGWKARHTQHLCCEYRRWLRRKVSKQGRVRSASGIEQRAALRAARIRKVFKKLGFKRMPPMARKRYLLRIMNIQLGLAFPLQVNRPCCRILQP